MVRDKQWDIVVVGSANTDYLVRGPRLPKPGETAPGDAYQEAPGGKGANQAVAAARLGAKVALVARVGIDRRGDEVMARLNTEGIDTRFVVRDPTAPTGVALVMVGEGGEKEIMGAPGANFRMSQKDVQSATEVLEGSHVLLVQLEVPLEAVSTAMQIAHGSGALVVLDPAPPTELADEVLQLVDVIKPNATEAAKLAGREVADVASARDAARVLLQRGVRAVAVQAGNEGNLLVWRDGERWLPKVPVESVDATGAGDAFAAALAVLLAEGKQLAEAGVFANAAAALATTKLGAMAGLPKRNEVESLLASQDTASDHEQARNS